MRVISRIAALTLPILWLSSVALSLAVAEDDAYLPPPSYPNVVELRRAGKPVEALAALEEALKNQEGGEQAIEALVLRAALLSEAGSALESDAAWLEAGAREGALKPFAIRMLVRNQIILDDPASALRSLNSLLELDGSSYNIDLILGVADSFLAAKSFSEAEDLYRRALRIHRRSEYADRARLGLAACLEAQNNVEGAISELRLAQLYHAGPQTFTAAGAEEKRLCGYLQRAQQPFSEDQYLSLARSLRGASRFDEATGILDTWKTHYPSTGRAERIELERIETLYRKRSNGEALSCCHNFYRNYPSSSLINEVRFLQMRLAVREGRTDEVQFLAELLRSGGVSRSTRHNAGLVLASYLVSVGLVEDGLDAYRAIYRETTSSQGKRSILWRAGVAALRAGQNQRALTNLRALIRLRPSDELLPAGLYWLAVAEAVAGSKESALRALLQLDERYTYHYYGLRAKLLLASLQKDYDPARLSSLRRSVSTRGLTFPSKTISAGAKQHRLFKAASILARAGLLAEAAQQLKRLLRALPRDKALALTTMRAAAETGDYRGAISIIATHFRAFLDRQAEGVPEDFWLIAFPRPFWNQVLAGSKALDIDPHLMFALMRRESRFDADALSVAGAVGLFQIMPYTAERFGRQMQISKFSEDILKDPKVNAEIAARLVSSLMEQFDRMVVPTIAAYNAGEDRVGAWWTAERSLPDDLFIDCIPYSETRGFVREVITNYFTYNRLYPHTDTTEGS